MKEHDCCALIVACSSSTESASQGGHKKVVPKGDTMVPTPGARSPVARHTNYPTPWTRALQPLFIRLGMLPQDLPKLA